MASIGTLWTIEQQPSGKVVSLCSFILSYLCDPIPILSSWNVSLTELRGLFYRSERSPLLQAFKSISRSPTPTTRTTQNQNSWPNSLMGRFQRGRARMGSHYLRARLSRNIVSLGIYPAFAMESALAYVGGGSRNIGPKLWSPWWRRQRRRACRPVDSLFRYRSRNSPSDHPLVACRKASLHQARKPYPALCVTYLKPHSLDTHPHDRTPGPCPDHR